MRAKPATPSSRLSVSATASAPDAVADNPPATSGSKKPRSARHGARSALPVPRNIPGLGTTLPAESNLTRLDEFTLLHVLSHTPPDGRATVALSVTYSGYYALLKDSVCLAKWKHELSDQQLLPHGVSHAAYLQRALGDIACLPDAMRFEALKLMPAALLASDLLRSMPADDGALHPDVAAMVAIFGGIGNCAATLVNQTHRMEVLQALAVALAQPQFSRYARPVWMAPPVLGSHRAAAQMRRDLSDRLESFLVEYQASLCGTSAEVTSRTRQCGAVLHASMLFSLGAEVDHQRRVAEWNGLLDDGAGAPASPGEAPVPMLKALSRSIWQLRGWDDFKLAATTPCTRTVAFKRLVDALPALDLVAQPDLIECLIGELEHLPPLQQQGAADHLRDVAPQRFRNGNFLALALELATLALLQDAVPTAAQRYHQHLDTFEACSFSPAEQGRMLACFADAISALDSGDERSAAYDKVFNRAISLEHGPTPELIRSLVYASLEVIDHHDQDYDRVYQPWYERSARLLQQVATMDFKARAGLVVEMFEHAMEHGPGRAAAEQDIRTYDSAQNQLMRMLMPILATLPLRARVEVLLSGYEHLSYSWENNQLDNSTPAFLPVLNDQLSGLPVEARVPLIVAARKTMTQLFDPASLQDDFEARIARLQAAELS